jgi:pimeloyl-ACP methyl ester carboxylesterase
MGDSAPGAFGELRVGETKLEAVQRGAGQTILFLHPEIGLDPASPALDALAKSARVIAPSHPGFGRSELPAGFNHIDDLAYFYLDLIEQHDLRDVTLVGSSIGGFIALEIAIKASPRVARLVLADSYGVKFGAPTDREIADIFAQPPEELARLSFHDPALGAFDGTKLTEEEAFIVARNREAAVRFGWSPYMHDTKLRGRLRRVKMPTLVLWGDSDGIVKPDYGRQLASAIAGARFRLIERCGHYPHIERPDVFAGEVLAFMRG